MERPSRNGKVPLSLLLTGLVVVLLFAGLVSLIAWQRSSVPTYDEEVTRQRLKNLADLNADNDKVLNHYRWVDRAKGVVGIPIDRAKQLVLADLEANKPHPAGPVNPPVPAPNAAGGTAPVANPAASPSPAAGVQPANPAPDGAAPPAPIANPQSVPAPSPSATPAPSPAGANP